MRNVTFQKCEHIIYGSSNFIVQNESYNVKVHPHAKMHLTNSDLDSSGSVKRLPQRVFLKQKFGETKLH